MTLAGVQGSVERGPGDRFGEIALLRDVPRTEQELARLRPDILDGPRSV